MPDIGGGTNPSTPGRWITSALGLATLLGVTWWVGGRALVDPDAIRREAEVDLQSGRYEEVEDGLARLPAPGPRDWLLKAMAARSRNHPEGALAALARIPDGDPSAAEASLLRGQVELRRDRSRAAEISLRAAIAKDPALVQAHRELIYLYSMQLRRRDLGLQFRALAREVPLGFDNVFHWCLTRNIVWEPHEQAKHLRRFLEADPEDRWSRVALAESLRQLGRLAEAKALLAALPDPDPEARAVRARIALDKGEDRAVEALLADGPADHPELARLRGRYALAHRDAASAVRHFRAAYDAEPDNRDTAFGLAASLSAIGDQTAAAPFRELSRDFDTVGSLVARAAAPASHDDPTLLKKLGAACEEARLYPEAYAWYRLCIRITPLDQDAQVAVARLGQYQPRRR